MERLSRVVGPVSTNVHILADSRSREAIAIDTATPSMAWIADELAARDWTLKLIVSTHGHWDHIGDNAAVAEHTGAEIAVHPADRDRLEHPQPLFAPFEGKKGESRGYYEVPIEILESADDLVKWARAAQRTPPLTKKR